MKTTRFFGYAWVMAVASSLLMAAPQSEGCNQVIRLSDLNDHIIQDFSQGKMGDFVVECPEGASLPFRLKLKGEFLELEPASLTPLRLNVLKTCYVRCLEKDNFLFSTDLTDWKGFSEFFTGSIDVSIEVGARGPQLLTEVELNSKRS